MSSRFAILVFVFSYEITLVLYAPAPVFISTDPGAVLVGEPYASTDAKSLSSKPPPSATTVLNDTALATPVPVALRPRTLSVGCCGSSA